MDEKTERFLKLAPQLREKDMDAINGLFQPMIFRRRKSGEIWTSCCRQHRVLDGRTTAEWKILTAAHCPEPISSRYWTMPKNEFESSRRVTCPICGREAKLKELQYTGERKNLWSFHRAVVLRQWRGALWAMAYDATKGYDGHGIDDRGLTDLPQVRLVGAYRFRPGVAEGAMRSLYYQSEFGRVETVNAVGKGRTWMLNDPYPMSNEYGKSYELVGLDEVAKSRLRYCQIDRLQTMCDPIRLLTLCCFYPQQVEYLTKAGLSEAVVDYVDRGVRNANCIHWDATDRKDFIGLPPKEVAAVAAAGGVDTLYVYRKLHGTVTVEEASAFAKAVDAATRRTVVGKCRTHGISLSKVIKYIARLAEAENRIAVYSTGQEYRDYLVAAEAIGLDLSNPIHFMPRDFRDKHDEVTAEYAAMQAAKENEKERVAYQSRYDKLTAKYEFDYAGLRIVVPEGRADIALEGKRLHHCVGGYASRHMDGVTTILFLRREEKPGRSLVTIEISGNTVFQAHGWDDERTPCPDNPERKPPMKLYQEFFDCWLAWLKAGSKRNKDGRPKLPKKYQEEKIA